MLDANMWRIEFYLDMVEQPEQEHEHEDEDREIEFYPVTSSNELPF